MKSHDLGLSSLLVSTGPVPGYFWGMGGRTGSSFNVPTLKRPNRRERLRHLPMGMLYRRPPMGPEMDGHTGILRLPLRGDLYGVQAYVDHNSQRGKGASPISGILVVCSCRISGSSAPAVLQRSSRDRIRYGGLCPTDLTVHSDILGVLQSFLQRSKCLTIDPYPTLDCAF